MYNNPLSRSTDKPDRPNQASETITRLDGSVAPLNQVNQERRQRSVYGRDPLSSDPVIDNNTMKALPLPNTRFGAVGGGGSLPYTPEAIRGIQHGLRPFGAPSSSNQGGVPEFARPTKSQVEAPQAARPIAGEPGRYHPPSGPVYGPEPSAMQRFTRAFAAHHNLTEDLMARGLNYTPQEYNDMRARRARGQQMLPQPPASTALGRGVEYLGKVGKELIDPIGLAATLYGKPLQAAVGGGGYEGAREAMNQYMRTGSVPDKGNVAKQGLFGGIGSYIGSKLFSQAPRGMLDKQPEGPQWASTLGRMLGANVSGNVIHDVEAEIAQ